MSPSKQAYLDAIDKTREMGRSALAIQALHTQGLAQEIVDNLNLAPEEYIPAEYEGGVAPELAKAVAEAMLEDAKARRQAFVELRSSIMNLQCQKYRGVVADLSDRIQALDCVFGDGNTAGSGGGGGGKCGPQRGV